MSTSSILRIIAIYISLIISCQKQDAPGDQKKGVPNQSVLTQNDISPAIAASIISPFNRGVSLMDQYHSVQAAEEFKKVTQAAPALIAGHLNLGIALLNTQKDSDLPTAELELKKVLELDPANPYAHYSLGMLYKHLNRYEEARLQFETVLEQDSTDADTHYQLAILIIDQEPAKARAHLEKTLEQIPHHEAALYRYHKLLQGEGDSAGANEILKRYHAIKSAEAGVIYGMKYGEMGKYAEVVRTLGIPAEGNGTAAQLYYTDIAGASGLTAVSGSEPGWPGSLSTVKPSAFGPGIAAARIGNGQGMYFYLTQSGKGNSGVLYDYRAGKFTRLDDRGLDGRDAIGAFFADFDRDGDADIYLTCAGPNRLYRNERDSVFTDITELSGCGGGDLISVGAAWADADHDGDLDLYVANYVASKNSSKNNTTAPNYLWRNNGDGTFTDTAGTSGIDCSDASSISVLFDDIDEDRDLDIYVINEGSPNRVFFNDRVGQYSEMPAHSSGLTDPGPGTCALAGDIDGNGLNDLILFRGPSQPKLFLKTPHHGFLQDTTFAGVGWNVAGATGGLLGDLDLDGDLDLILLGAEKHNHTFRDEIFINNGSGLYTPGQQLGPEKPNPVSRGAMVVDLDQDGSLEVLITHAGGPPTLWHTDLTGDQHWLEVTPVMRDETGVPAVDPAAIGLTVEIKTGRRLQVANLLSGSGYLGAPLPVLHFGLGKFDRADYVRLTWPDALFQSEMEVAADQSWEITKIEKKPSSCPMLFSWDGDKFAFVTDMLGVGGVGFFIEPGFYGPPDPTEDILIPADQIKPRGGRYLLRVSEPLEEASYVDQLYLIAYDHPETYELFPDERFTGSPPFPTGEPVCVGDKIFPGSVLNDRGDDLTQKLRKIDRDYADPPLDERFVGYAHDHWIELDFGNRLEHATAGNELILYLYGWVEYTYSHVNYAAYQAGITMHSPWIEIPNGRGGWEVAVPEAGFPAGLPRMMSFDLSAVPLETGKLRIRSNMEIYWDQIYAGVNVCGPELQKHVLTPVQAELRSVGIPREYSPDGKNPTLYDYQRIETGVPFKNMTGNYTRFGDVTDLLESVDDQFVIMGHGEEIALEFSEKDLPVLQAGWTRTFVLHADGYCKDMDLYTAYPNTIGPLPYHGMENYPPEVLSENGGALSKLIKLNTRYIAGY